MEKRYWMHRISHEWEVSYSLLAAGYLSIGWRYLLGSDLMERIQTGEDFSAFMEEHQESSRSRWNLWRFSRFRPGELVVVPLFDKEFTIVEVTGTMLPAGALAGMTFTSQKGELVETREDGFWKTSTGIHCDIGYLVPVRARKERPIPRSFADAPLIRKMKLRQNNADITSTAKSVEAAILANGPVSLHSKLMEAVAGGVQTALAQYVTPDNLERLVSWYMEKKGADHVWIPAKNEPGKENGADADVIAEFDDLRVIFYIQVKSHEGKTGDWAVRQISEYTSQKQDDADDYTYIPWVISTAEFEDGAIQDAKKKGVRLIGGSEFVTMLVDCGIDDIDAAF